jgi:hypothetical protein
MANKFGSASNGGPFLLTQLRLMQDGILSSVLFISVFSFLRNEDAK